MKSRKLIRLAILEALDKEDIDSMMQLSNDKEKLKKKFRKLAMKYHPDRNQDSPTANADFQDLSNLYDRLKEPRSHSEPSGQQRYQQRHDSQPPPREETEAELIEKIKGSRDSSSFFETYVKIARMKVNNTRYNYDPRKMQTTIENLRDIINEGYTNTTLEKIKKINSLGIRISGGNIRHILYSTMLLEKAYSEIAGSQNITGFARYYIMGAEASPMNTQSRREVLLSIDAVREIQSRMSFLNRAKYMFFGTSKKDYDEMYELISQVKSLTTDLPFHFALFEAILK